MDPFLTDHKLPNPRWRQISWDLITMANMTSKEKSLQLTLKKKKDSLGPDGFLASSTKQFKTKQNRCYKIPSRKKEEKYFPTLVMTPPSPWCENQTDRMVQAGILSKDAKLLKKMLANQIQQQGTRLMHRDQMRCKAHRMLRFRQHEPVVSAVWRKTTITSGNVKRAPKASHHHLWSQFHPGFTKTCFWHYSQQWRSKQTSSWYWEHKK